MKRGSQNSIDEIEADLRSDDQELKGIDIDLDADESKNMSARDPTPMDKTPESKKEPETDKKEPETDKKQVEIKVKDLNEKPKEEVEALPGLN